MVTPESLRQDPERRWNDNVTAYMDATTLYQYLLAKAEELDHQQEWECAYDIFRELVWRFPEDETIWRGLARTARIMRYEQEADVATLEAQKLAS